MEKTLLTAGLLLALLFSGAASAQSESAKPCVVAIVDVQRLLQEATAAKSVQQQLENRRAGFQTEVAAEEAELRKAEQKLAHMRETAKAQEYAEEEQKLRQRFLDVERRVQARRKALDQAFTDSMNAVKEGIVNVVSAVAKERGVNLAIVKQQVIWNDGAIDITNEVLARFNKAMPNLQVKIVPEEPAQGELASKALKRKEK